MEQKCANCGNGKWRDGITAITETCIKCHYVDKGALGTQPSNWKPKEQTNADRIRAMTDEELAQFLNTRGCPSENHSNCFEMSCKHCWEKWLKQPAEV